METAVQARGLRKRYVDEPVDALGGVHVSLARGGRAALVGPLRSGKSTLLRILAGRLAPTMGWVSVLGLDPFRNARRLRRRLAWIPAVGPAPSGLTIREAGTLVRALARCGDAFRFAQLCTSFDLDPERRVDGLDRPTLRFLHAALALQKNPAVVLSDAPPTPADVEEDRTFHARLFAQCPRGTTLLVAARQLESVLGHVEEIHLLRDGLVVERCIPDDVFPHAARHEALEALPAPFPAAGAAAAPPSKLTLFDHEPAGRG